MNFGITLAEFFAEETESNPLKAELLSSFRQLSEEKQAMVVSMVKGAMK